MKRVLLFLVFCILLVRVPVWAHEVRPAYLMLEEQQDNVFSVLWKMPVVNGYMPDIQLVLPDCQEQSQPFAETRDGAVIRTWTMRYGTKGIEGEPIAVKGLSGTLIDVIVQIRWNDGRELSMLLTPDQTRGRIGTRQKSSQPYQFLPMGIKHILSGFDHLAFLLCVLLFVRRFVPLLKTITAFTLAHSITLFLVSLKVITVPAAPVEVMVAFSIVLLAAEVLKKNKSSVSKGWKLTFIFGLLHGLGFASALQGIGLPEDGVLTALFLFNLGVEIGQIAFVLSVLVFLGALERIRAGSRLFVETVAVNLAGMTAVFWMIQRLGTIIHP